MNRAIEHKDRGGLVGGERHVNGGTPFVLSDTGTHIEEEKDEVNIPREIADSDKVYEFEGTNYEILNKVLKLGGLKLTNKVTEVKSGDIVICIKSAWDETPRKYKGTVRQILSAINESRGCNHIESGATMTNLETGATVSMGRGGGAGQDINKDDEEHRWRNIKNAEGKNIIEKILFVLHNNPFYVEHEKFSNVHLAPIINMVMEQYLIYDRSNPIITKFGEPIYFEPHEEHFRRKGVEISRIEYATHFVTGYTYPDGIQKRIWDKSKYDSIQFLIPVLKSDGVQRLYQIADPIKKRQEAIVYAEEITIKRGLCVILITEINKNGSVRAISFLPKEKRGYIEKQKASGVWSDAFVFSPPTEKPPFDKGRTNAAGGSLISSRSYNKGNKIFNNGTYPITFFNADLQPVIEAEVNGGIKISNKNVSLGELYDLYQKRTKSGSYLMGGNISDRAKTIVEKLWGSKSSIGLNVDERKLLESIIVDFLKNDNNFMTQSIHPVNQGLYKRLLDKKIIEIHKFSETSTHIYLTNLERKEVRNAIENEGMSNGGKAGEKMVTLYMFFGSYLQDGSLFAPFSIHNNKWTTDKAAVEKMFNEAGLKSFKPEDLEKVKPLYRDGVLLFEMHEGKIPESDWKHRNRRAKEGRWDDENDYISAVMDYGYEMIKERAIFIDGEKVSKKELAEYFEGYEKGGLMAGGGSAKREYEVREYKDGRRVSTELYNSLDEVGKVQKNDAQVTFEDLEIFYRDGDWTHVIEYRDDEHYNDMYFVPSENFKKSSGGSTLHKGGHFSLREDSLEEYKGKYLLMIAKGRHKGIYTFYPDGRILGDNEYIEGSKKEWLSDRKKELQGGLMSKGGEVIIDNSTEESYCSFEVSKLLKEKGFEVPTDRYYRSDGKMLLNVQESYGEREYRFDADDFTENWNKKGWVIGKDGGMCFGCKLDNVKYFTPYSVPSHALAIEWVRVNFGIWITVIIAGDESYYGEKNNKYFYSISQTKRGKIIADSWSSQRLFNSPQEATEQALLYALKNLIQEHNKLITGGSMSKGGAVKNNDINWLITGDIKIFN